MLEISTSLPMGGATLNTSTTDDATNVEPYTYQFGFGNHHVTEAIPGALPSHGTNLPQKSQYGLYPEHLNGTPFISSRDTVSNVWMYRERPSAAHRPVTQVEEIHLMQACFLPTNPDVSFTPLGHTWGPLTVTSQTPQPDSLSPSNKVNFIQGLKTIGGHGDATLKEGLAVHQYAFDTNMNRQAFINHDGDFLLVPQQGVLDIKTELGMLRVRPGMIAVLPAGIRFSISIVPTITTNNNTEVRGYVLEIFGTHCTLPDLGVLGANGLAHVRDFEYPVAAFDFSPPPPPHRPIPPPWTITLKLSGRLSSYTQPHTPFDVVAWHGRYAPFRYDLSHFCQLTANTDQLDPTAYCVLTAPSKWPGVSLVDFCVFGEKWVVAKDTLRIPYYHRTLATEVCGVIKGKYMGSVRPLEEGGLTFEQGYMPHGESYESWKRDREGVREAGVVGKGYLGFMFHISSHMALTKWAMEEHPDIRFERHNLWDSVRTHLVDHIDEINISLKQAGMRTLPTNAEEEETKANQTGQNHLPTPPTTPNCALGPDPARMANLEVACVPVVSMITD